MKYKIKIEESDNGVYKIWYIFLIKDIGDIKDWWWRCK